jgi:serine/threonine protein kinase
MPEAGDPPFPQIAGIEIISCLGQGGVSRVYKARQLQLDRLVAVKVLSVTKTNSQDLIRRFHKEAKLTSALVHPNIVKTISSGIAADGSPYLVMEYLEGLSLAQELKEHGRLMLQKFRNVLLPALSALEHAHQAGVIHRDIKPGNIMLCCSEDGEETVKLVDFGIAKVYAESESPAQSLTRTECLLGTPAYMSPEQCLARPLDGRSDLYSLACVMYESLSGEAPFRGDSSYELMHKHSQAPPPSPADLKARVEISNELAEAIVHGLAKDPADRPQTARAFAAELKAALEDVRLDRVPRLKSTAASPKHFRTMLFSAGAILFLVLLSSLSIFNTNRSPVTTQLSKPETEEQRNEADALRNLIRIENHRGQDSPLVARPLARLADVFIREKKYDKAEPLLKRLLAIREKANDQDLPETIYQLGDCCNELGRHSQAESLFKRSLSIYENSREPNRLGIAKVLTHLGSCYQQEKKYTEAESTFKRAITSAIEVYGSDQKEVGDAITRLARFYQYRGRNAEAEPLFKSSLSMREKDLGREAGMDMISRLDSYVLREGDRGFPHKKNGQAAAFLPAGTFQKAKYDRDYVRLIIGLQELADCYAEENKSSQALPLYQRALVISEQIVQVPQKDLIPSLSRIAWCYGKLGDHKKAGDFWKRAIATREDNNSDRETPTLDSLLQELADCYARQGNYAAAEPYYQRVLSLRKEDPNQTTRNLIIALTNLISCYKQEGKLAQADALRKERDQLKQQQE